MQEGEAHGAGSDVAETPLRAEEKTSVVPVWGGAGLEICRKEVKQGSPHRFQLL